MEILHKTRLSIVPVILSFLFLAVPSPALSGHAQHPVPIDAVTCQTDVRYSPHGGAAAVVISTLDRAEQTVHVAIYGLTHSGIVDALIAAQGRGVEIVVKTDRLQSAGQAQSAAIARLEEAGVTVEVSNQSRQLHDKFAVIDGRWVVTGSFNWTTNAENRNRENLVILDCPDLAQNFEAEWELIRPDAP